MTSTDVATLDEQYRYAQALTMKPDGSGPLMGSLLPKAYQGSPGNVLIAMGLGGALGISPAQALYEIYVVNGRPSPSANLMAGLVRKAGHKLRIEGDTSSCTATLIRSDDPEYPFVATWTIDQARAAGLTGKDTWKQYPAAMLRARAIAEVVRMGASEAVLGMEYAKEEMQDVEDVGPVTAIKAPGLAGLRAAVPAVQQPNSAEAATSAASITVQQTANPVEHYDQTQTNDEVHDAEEVADETETGEQATDGQRGKMFALFGEAGFDTDARTNEGRAARLTYISNLLGIPMDSTKHMTKAQVSAVIESLLTDAATRAALAEPSDEAQQ